MKTILVTIAFSALLLGLAVIMFGFRLLFVKGGKFPSGHVHDNPELRRRGIGCANED